MKTCLATIFGSIFLAVAVTGSFQNHFKTEYTRPYQYSEIVELKVPMYEPPEVPEIHLASYEAREYLSFTDEEAELLERISMAEAEGEDTIGKALVMRVVLNRVEKTGGTIEGVIYATGQFATQRMYVSPNEDSHKALEMVMDGWDESQGALYFAAGGYNYYGDEKLFIHGGHGFSR